MKINRMLTTTVCLLIISLSGQGFAQIIDETSEDLFTALINGRSHSSRSEAMGKTGLLVGGDAFGHAFNPATAGLNRNIAIGYSYSNPFYALSTAKYDYLGLAFNTNPYGSFGFSRFYFHTGKEPETGFPWEGSLFTLSYAFNITKKFFAGISLNNITQNILNNSNQIDKTGSTDPVSAPPRERSSFFATAGFLYVARLNDSEETSHQLRFGATLYNFTNGNLIYSFGSGFIDDTKLPITFRGGALYKFSNTVTSPDPKKTAVELILAVEFSNSFNYDKRSTVNTGVELFLFNLLSLRSGYYTEKSDLESTMAPIRDINAVTFGFGITVPVMYLTGNKWPVDVRIDVLQLNKPESSLDIRRGKYKTISANVNLYF